MFVPEQREYLHRLSLSFSLVRSACSALRNHDLFKEIFKRAEKRSSPFLIASIPPPSRFRSKKRFASVFLSRFVYESFLTSNFFSMIILEFIENNTPIRYTGNENLLTSRGKILSDYRPPFCFIEYRNVTKKLRMEGVQRTRTGLSKKISRTTSGRTLFPRESRSDSSTRRTTNNFLQRHRHLECLPRSSAEASANLDRSVGKSSEIKSLPRPPPKRMPRSRLIPLF